MSSAFWGEGWKKRYSRPEPPSLLGPDRKSLVNGPAFVLVVDDPSASLLEGWKVIPVDGLLVEKVMEGFGALPFKFLVGVKGSS